ncbi:hypothetical protein EON73_05270 [bacterium]|nr:MAG: hypothetical protein EON73_05270 [bacterium]
MQTLKVDIINDKALDLLKEMELLNLICLHEANDETPNINIEKFKGAMTKQPLNEIDNQLQNLRDSWE